MTKTATATNTFPTNRTNQPTPLITAALKGFSKRREKAFAAPWQKFTPFMACKKNKENKPNKVYRFQ